MFLVFIQSILSANYEAVLGYNSVTINSNEKTTIKGKIGTLDEDFYIVFHNPDYFYNENQEELITILKNKQSTQVISKQGSKELKFHLINVNKTLCNEVQFILNFNPEPVYQNVINAHYEDNFTYCYYLASILPLSYKVKTSAPFNAVTYSTNGVEFKNLNDGYALSNSVYSPLLVKMVTQSTENISFGISFMHSRSKMQSSDRLAFGPMHYGSINPNLVYFIHSRNGNEKREKVTLNYTTELIPGVYDLEIIPEYREFHISKDTFLVFSHLVNAQFEGYIENKPKDVKLFQGQFGGRAIRFTRSASLFIKSDFYPLLRITVFSTKKHPYCNFQVASMGMTSFTIANNIPPGNLTSSSASSYCIFYSYPYEGINGTLINTGKKFKTRLYNVMSKTTNDIQQPVMLYLYGKSSSVQKFQVGINYDYFDSQNFHNGVISQTLNPFLVTIGVYAPIAWISISVVVFLIIVSIVIGVVYYRRKKKTKGYSEISEADPLTI